MNVDTVFSSCLYIKMQPFPYKKEFINPDDLFNNCCNLDLAPLTSLSIPNINEERPFHWRSIPRYIRWEFKGKLLGFVVKSNTYDKGDKLVDYFSEQARIKAYRKGKPSPYQFYIDNYSQILSKAQELNNNSDQQMPYRHWIREAIYEMVPECTNFKISVTKSLFNFFNSKFVLDPSAGWGDRILGAASANVQVYHGIDPNTRLRKPYNEILKFIRKHGRGEKYRIITEDFLKVQLQQQSYDTVFTSPPFFDYEIYSEDEKQSITNKNTVDIWLNLFLLPYIEKAWNALAINGFFAIYISDTKHYKYVNKMFLFINKQLKGKFLGLLAVTPESLSHAYPIWIWRK